MKFDRDFKGELTINKFQQKDFDYYHKMMHSAFREMYRVLRSGRWMTVTFHNVDINVYNSFVRAAVFAGFNLESIIYQLPRRASFDALARPYGSAEGDYYVRFRKPEIFEEQISETEVDEERYERIVIGTVKSIIAFRGEPTTYTDILKGIYIELDKHGYLLVRKLEDVEKIIRKYEGKEFLFIEGEGWWFKDPGEYMLDIIPLQDRVETAVIQELRRRITGISFNDILRRIYIYFRNALTPYPTTIDLILKEYGEKTDGKWRLKTRVTRREKEHSWMLVCLAEIGRQFGYKIWIGLREQSDQYKNRRLEEWCDYLHLDLDGIAETSLHFIRQIDLLWIKNSQIEYSFEVEHTTAIMGAFNRCSNIPKGHGTKKVIVIPEERENFLFKKIQSRLLKDRLAKENWQFIFYKDAEILYNKGKDIELSDFQDLLKDLREERLKQVPLDSYPSE